MKKKLNLQDWSNIADIVSGIAIVLTLIFLIFEVRENTEITRAGAYERNIQSLNDVRTLIVSDPSLAANFNIVRRGDASTLSPEEHLRIRAWFQMLFGVYEKTYFAKQYGHIGDSEWSRFQFQICNQREKLVENPEMMESIQGVLTKEFSMYMEKTCGNKQIADE